MSCIKTDMSMHVPVFALIVMRATILGRHTTLTLKEGVKGIFDVW